MRALRRNKQKIYYCLLDKTSNVHIYDDYGNDTGEVVPVYGQPTELWVNVSAARGVTQTETFGDLDGYDKVMVTTWMECPIDEQTVLFVDKAPPEPTPEPTPDPDPTPDPEPENPDETSQDSGDVPPDTGSEDDSGTSGDDPEPTPMPEPLPEVPNYDYIVKRVARSLNCISYAITKVRVGE